MTTARLYVDGFGKGWAIVRCNVCTDVDKYPALDAFDALVKCKCGHLTNVRDALVAATRIQNTPRNLFAAFAGSVVPQLSRA